MADEQAQGLGGGSLFDPSAPQQSSDLGGGVLFDPTKGPPVDKAPPAVGDNHPLAQEVANKANRLQDLIRNAPQEAAVALAKHLPKGFLQSAVLHGGDLLNSSSTVRPLLDTAASIPGIVGGAAEAQVASDQGNKIDVLKSAGRTALNAAGLILPGEAAPVTEAGGEIASKIAGKVGHAFSPTLETFTPELEKALPPGVSDKLVQSLQPVPVPHPSEIQPEFQQGLKDIFQSVTRSTGGIPTQGETLAESLSGAVDTLRSQSKSIYERIDKAMGGIKFQTLDKEVDNLVQKLNDAPLDERAAIRAQLEDAQETQRLFWEKAVRNGNVTPADAEAAQTLHQRYRAMQEVENTLKKSIAIPREGYQGVPDARGVEQYIDPNGFYKKLKTLEDKSSFGGQRVSTALGEQADRLFQHVADHANVARDLSAQKNAAIQTNKENGAALDKYLASVERQIARVEKANQVTRNNNIAEKARVQTQNTNELNRVSGNKKGVAKFALRGAMTAAGAGALYEAGSKLAKRLPE